MTTQIIEQDERAGLPSASTFSRTVDCPGWNNLWREIVRTQFNGKPPETGTKYTERGNRIHRARETMNPMALQDESEIIAYERGCVLERDAINEWSEGFENKEAIEEGKREDRIWLHGDNLEPIISARMDIHYLYPPTQQVAYVDWKSGAAYGTGKARHNWQVKITAVLLRNEYDVQFVTGILLKMEAWPKGYYDLHRFDRPELDDIEAEARKHLDLAAQPNAPRRAGPQCDWCPCKAWCAEGQAYGMLPTVVARVGADLSKEDIEAKVQTLTIPDLVFIWLRRNASSNLQEAVLERLKTLPEKTLNEYGIRVAKGKDTSFVPPEKIKDVCAALIDEGFTEDQVWRCLEPSTSKLVAEHMALNPGATKTAVEKWVKAIVSKFKTEQRGAGILREI